MDKRVNIICGNKDCKKEHFSKLIEDYENQTEIIVTCPYCKEKAKIVLKKSSIKEVYMSIKL